MPRFEGIPVSGLQEDQSSRRFQGEPIATEEKEQTRKPHDSDWLNTVREALQGATLGFSDEIGAAMAAGAAWAMDGADLGEAYSDIVGAIREEQNAFREDSPILSTGAQIGGALLTGGAGLERLAASHAARPTIRVAQNALAGSVAGGTAGAGFADDNELEAAQTGAAFGAVGGVIGGEIGRAITNKVTQRAEARRLIKEGVLSDEKTALFYKAPSGKIKPDQLAKTAVDAGAPKPVVSLVKSGSAKDKAAIKRMIDLRRKGLTDRLFASKNNPNEVMGQSLKTRIDYVRQLREQASKEVGRAANALKGKDVDFKGAVDDFLDDLDSAGIKFAPDSGEIDFTGSDFEKLEGPMNVITRMVDRMYNGGKTPNAYDVHRLKKYIDENVFTGSDAEGAAKSYAISILKKLRHNIDGVLDNKFPEYDAANTKFAEATTALQAVQGALGKTFDLDAKNIDRMLGQKGRGLLSNAVFGRKLEDALLIMEDVADNYGKRFDDDLHLQASFASALEEMLGTTQKTSIQGVGENVMSQGARAAAGDGVGAGFEILKSIKGKKAMNDPEAMLDALEKLVAR